MLECETSRLKWLDCPLLHCHTDAYDDEFYDVYDDADAYDDDAGDDDADDDDANDDLCAIEAKMFSFFSGKMRPAYI